jgi:uncharacterized protein with ATP-grasp and redox domains
MPDRPPMIRTNGSNAFAHNTMKVRVPAIIRETEALNPDYPASIRAALMQFAHDMENDQPIPLIDALSPDYEQWAASYAPYAGDTWLNTDWFFAEIYSYRLLMQIVRWWETGRDPFSPKKAAELGSQELWERIEEVVSSTDKPFEECLLGLVYAALWGNRMDLSYHASQSHGTKSAEDDLLVDDAAAVVRHLLDHHGDIHMIIDNTGTELAMDLALADGLLQLSGNSVIIHPKIHPTFVSDATASDILTLIAKIQGQTNSSVRYFGDRLHQAFETGRLRFAPDFYWNSTRLLWDMPPHLEKVFQTAALVIIKGDANYRRMVGDILWPPESPFATVTNYFPAPLLALRTLKSDLVVGLPTGLVEHLDATDAHWCTNGRRGLIQFRAAI